jgi:hypothetical protein
MTLFYRQPQYNNCKVDFLWNLFNKKKLYLPNKQKFDYNFPLFFIHLILIKSIFYTKIEYYKKK